MGTQSSANARTDRRSILSLGLAATAGAIASMFAKSDKAIAGHDGTNVFHIGELNEATGAVGLATPTRLRADVHVDYLRPPGVNGPAAAALMVFNDGPRPMSEKGFGVYGWTSADRASGVFGENGAGAGPGVLGNSLAGAGVLGQSHGAVGVEGITGILTPTSNAPGVRGFSPTGPGVRGESSTGLGVEGSASGGTGVVGSGFFGGTFFASSTGSGVFAGSPNGFGIEAQGGRAGVAGRSGAGFGVLAESFGSQAGVRGTSVNGPGVEGFASQTGPGVQGFASTGTQPGVTGRPGVLGHASPTNTGVHGQSVGMAPGVSAEQAGSNGFALIATASQAGAIGIRTINRQGGIALDVAGRARFATSGTGTIPAKAESYVVADAAVQSNSSVLVTLTSDPGDASMLWVERNPGSGFVVHLTKKVSAATTFAYLITEPA